MNQNLTSHPLSARGKYQIIALIAGLLVLACLVTSLLSYYVSRDRLRSAIITQELPLTSDSIYAELQKDLLSPVLISSMMANNPLIQGWIAQGEKHTEVITQYLAQIRAQHKTDASFFVSAHTHKYYHADGLMRQVDPKDPRDAWFFKLQNSTEPYDIAVDLDERYQGVPVIFIDYRILDANKRFLGVTGVGLKAQKIQARLQNYEKNYKRRVYFVNQQGVVTISGSPARVAGQNLATTANIRHLLGGALQQQNSNWQYRDNGKDYQLNVRYLPETKWYLFVEKSEDEAFSDIRKTLYTNLLLSALIIPFILWIIRYVIKRYQSSLEYMASTDPLSTLYNRHAFMALAADALKAQTRHAWPLSILLLDLDHFKRINDHHGHPLGDQTIAHVATILRNKLRKDDIACRWGGEEFLILLQNCSADNAYNIAQELRLAIQNCAITSAASTIQCSASVGVAERIPGETLESLTARADQALYRAKNNGRNCVEMAIAE